MTCNACGAEIAQGAVFCPKCGERLNDDVESTESVESSSESQEASGAQEAEAANPAPSNASASSPAERVRSAMKSAAAEGAAGRGDDVEEDLWSGGYSAKAMVGPFLGAALLSAALLAAVIAMRAGSSTAWIALSVIMVLLWGYTLLTLAYRQLSVSYELTSQRFIHRVGLLRRVTDRIEVIDMDDVTFEQGIVERMFNVGTIRVISSDRSHPELVLRGIDNVKYVADMIDDVRRKERRSRGLHIEAI